MKNSGFQPPGTTISLHLSTFHIEVRNKDPLTKNMVLQGLLGRVVIERKPASYLQATLKEMALMRCKQESSDWAE
jgi:hypothetical protein